MSYIKSNRENSKKSTGPKTTAGNKRSSLNALRHGLTSQMAVMPSEDLAAYQQHLKAYTGHYQPQGIIEADLVQFLADASWRLKRVAALEAKVMSLGTCDEPESSDVRRQFRHSMTLATALENQSKIINNLSMHSQRLSRQFQSTEAHLRTLQQSRRALETSELRSLLLVKDMQDSKGIAWNPTKNGFVFSTSRIESAIQTRNRENLIHQARDYADKKAAA